MSGVDLEPWRYEQLSDHLGDVERILWNVHGKLVGVSADRVFIEIADLMETYMDLCEAALRQKRDFTELNVQVAISARIREWKLEIVRAFSKAGISK